MLSRNGYHFRRQVPLSGFVADFVEHGHKLVVELDGSQHSLEPKHARDALRDKTIKNRDIRCFVFGIGNWMMTSLPSSRKS